MKKLYMYSTIIFFVFGILLSTAFTTEEEQGKRTNEDVIIFSHALHSEVIDCESCHVGVTESTSLSDALLPKMDQCGMCHDVEDMDNCGLCHYEDVYETYVEDETELIFNHQFHYEDQELACLECHKELDEVNYSFEAEHPNPPMSQCYTCHNDLSAATDECSACHQSTVNLIPQDHRTASFFDNHKFSAMAADANCAMCHDNSFCEDCHVSTTMIDESNTLTDFYTPYSPHKYIDDSKAQKITRVHDLNYRFSHGIDAKGKTSECQTCHEVETFCAECHSSSGGDFASEGILPSSHLKQNFIMIGVGSGGGEHAKLARRDIERCASCHDVQGADPNCILCHTDPDGIAGTNPKTHELNFMGNEEGDWHSDAGSVCYSCHTDANAYPGGNPNMGFCSYCHNQ